MTEIDLIIDLHKNTNRQGPGTEADTLRALSFIPHANSAHMKMADLGCGSGGQTITLASHSAADIIAVDLFPAFLHELNRKASESNLSQRISTVEASIDNLPFEKHQFDIIWSEGAIYNIGFEKGITLWRDYLKPGGYLAISEITWITNTRPSEVENFWTNAYPQIGTAASKISILENQGFTLTGYFYLQPESWFAYYNELEAIFPEFLERHQHSSEAGRLIDEFQKEINTYKKFKDYYSYGFYIAKKD